MELLTSMLSHWQGALAVLLVLGGLIFFHELGHFSIARVFRIGVGTFSLGFGPRLYTRRVGNTDYCLSLVPLGGYVSLVGEGGEEDEEARSGADDRIFSEREAFFARPAWQRMCVIAAGPVANFILAWILYSILAFSQGASFLLPVVGKVVDGAPAAAAGFEAGDVLLAINGEEVRDWSQLSEAVQMSNGQALQVSILRGPAERALSVTPHEGQRKTIFGEVQQTWQIGVIASGEIGHTPLGAGAAMGEGVRKTWEMTAFTVEGIIKLFQRIVPIEAVGGPIMIAQAVGQQAQEGIVGVLLIAALISVNLGLLNLLPIPVLDGGHLVFLAFEMLFRRPVGENVQELSTRVGIVLLVGLMLLATWNDIVRLLS